MLGKIFYRGESLGPDIDSLVHIFETKNYYDVVSLWNFGIKIYVMCEILISYHACELLKNISRTSLGTLG